MKSMLVGRSVMVPSEETRFVTIRLPVDGGQSFDWTVDDMDMVFTAPEGKKKGDEHEFAFTSTECQRDPIMLIGGFVGGFALSFIGIAIALHMLHPNHRFLATTTTVELQQRFLHCKAPEPPPSLPPKWRPLEGPWNNSFPWETDEQFRRRRIKNLRDANLTDLTQRADRLERWGDAAEHNETYAAEMETKTRQATPGVDGTVSTASASLSTSADAADRHKKKRLHDGKHDGKHKGKPVEWLAAEHPSQHENKKRGQGAAAKAAKSSSV